MRRLGRVEGDYEPQKKIVPVLDAAMRHIKSVPYQVTLRWVFYRLLQDGIYKEKSDYNAFRRIQAQARKHFYNGWRPDTFADDTREFIEQGDYRPVPANDVQDIEKKIFEKAASA